MSLVDTKANIKSTEIQVFPASRRGTDNYTSRLFVEDNVRRMIQLPFWSPEKGNVIISFKNVASIDSCELELCIKGYYFKLFGSSDVDNIVNKIINIKAGNVTDFTGAESLWLYFDQDQVSTTKDTTYKIKSFGELKCVDDKKRNTFDGLHYTNENPNKEFSIELLIPNPACDTPKYIFNPALCIDNSINSDWAGGFVINMLLPYFISDEDFAMSSRSDKNKIWIDTKYNVPHVCVDSAATTAADMWLPLGAVYKTDN